MGRGARSKGVRYQGILEYYAHVKTIDEFLTERLDEDKRRSEDVHHWHCLILAPDAGAVDVDACDCGEPKRAARSIKADRLLIQEYRETSKLGLDPESIYALEDVLKIRAYRYADHEDFNSAWERTL